MAEFKKLPKFTTPRGRFSFPKLLEPDTKFKPEGEYSVKLILDEADANALIDKLTPLHAAADEEGKELYKKLPIASRKKMEAKGGGYSLNPLFTPVYGEDEQETGEFEFKFGMKASGVSKKTNKSWKRKPELFDAKGRPIVKTANLSIGGGTIGRVSFEAMPYFVPGTGAAGLSLRLLGVQIIELREGGGGRTASQHGFDAEDDGYEYSPNAKPSAEDDEDFEEDADNPDEASEDTGSDVSEDEDF